MEIMMINGYDEFPMALGDGPSSYNKNCVYQRRCVIASKQPMQEVVDKALSFDELCAWHQTFRIADMGCSVGPNTFISVQKIIEALANKYETLKQYNSNNNNNNNQHFVQMTPQFQVFFNDHAMNDFNMLFRSLPNDKNYYAAGVPGSFYSKVFPDASLHLVNCSFGLHFLSRVPKGVVEKDSIAWNKGKIFYSHSKVDVAIAYSEQYAGDMDSFLDARSKEIVPGGLLLFAVPARPDGVPHSQVYFNVLTDILGSCFLDLANKGVIDEEKIDSFNIPIYFTSPQEVKDAIERNGCFDIVKLESLPKETTPSAVCKPHDASIHIRAVTEHLIKEKFGLQVSDQLFELYNKKVHDAFEDLHTKSATNLFVALKRKA